MERTSERPHARRGWKARVAPQLPADHPEAGPSAGGPDRGRQPRRVRADRLPRRAADRLLSRGDVRVELRRRGIRSRGAALDAEHPGARRPRDAVTASAEVAARARVVRRPSILQPHEHPAVVAWWAARVAPALAYVDAPRRRQLLALAA